MDRVDRKGDIKHIIAHPHRCEGKYVLPTRAAREFSTRGDEAKSVPRYINEIKMKMIQSIPKLELWFLQRSKAMSSNFGLGQH